jgi:UDP-glucose 6-dehydrogenase
MKIAVVGLGYVGLSNAVLLAQRHEVTAVDVSRTRVDLVNDRKSPIVEATMVTAPKPRTTRRTQSRQAKALAR